MTTFVELRELMDPTGIRRAVDRMALQLEELAGGGQDLALVGIHTGGVPLAQRLKSRLDANTGADIPLGMIDITLYRDDVFIGLPHPIVGRTELDFDITGKRVVLVDDVLYTGRTVRSALDALTDFGRPHGIQLAVLVDRGLRELPIQPDVVGLRISSEPTHSVEVALTELGADRDRVTLRQKREDA